MAYALIRCKTDIILFSARPRGPVSCCAEGAVAGQGGEDPGGVAVRTPALLGTARRHCQVRRRPQARAHGLSGPQTVAGQ